MPEGRGPAPAAPRAPIGPNVQESSGRLSQMATFQDMLTNPHDEDLFEHFATGQLARIDTETGQITRIGPAALITGAELSPDEKYLLVEHDPPSVLLSRAVLLLRAQDRGLGRERPAGRHDRRPADLRRRSSPGRADRARGK